MRSSSFLSSMVPSTVRNAELPRSTGVRSFFCVRIAAAVLGLSLAGCGGSDSVDAPIQAPQPTPPPVVAPPPPPAAASAVARFAYAANAADGTISIYAVDSRSGQLRANGYVDAGVNARAIAVDPSHTFVYAVVNAGVFAARINAETGALTPIAGSPFATGTVPMAITVDPTGRYVYVANRDSDNISAYSIDSASGALAPVAGSPFAAGDAPKSITVDPAGKFVYVANKDSDNVSAFRIDPATGSLAPIAGAPFASGIEPNSIAIHPSGRFAYVANGGEFVNTGTISVYGIDATSGVLTPASAAVAAKSFPEAVTTNRAGTFLYAANGGSNNVSAYAISSGGTLTEVAGSPYSTGRGALSVLVDPSDGFVYVATGRSDSNDIAAFSIDSATGALSPLVASPLTAARANPVSLAIAGGAKAVEFSSQFVYVANFQSDNLSAYTIDAATGVLTAIPGSPFAAGASPIAVAIDPLNRYVYVANYLAGISAYRIEGATGALTPVAGNPVAAEPGVSSIAVDPSGRFVYVISGETAGAYAIDAATGALTQLADSPYALDLRVDEGGVGQQGLIAVDPRGKTVYVTAGTAENIEALRIDPATGALTPVSGTPFEVGQETIPTSISIHPAGKFAYVGLGGRFQNLAYKIDSMFAVDPVDPVVAVGPVDLAPPIVRVITGAIEFLAGTPPVPNSFSSSLAVDVTGRFAYALDGSSNNLRGYRVNAQSGELTALAGGPLATGGVGGFRTAHDASGKFVYVLNLFSGNVSAFAINAADGSLAAVPGSPFAAGANPRSIAVSGRVH